MNTMRTPLLLLTVIVMASAFAGCSTRDEYVEGRIVEARGHAQSRDYERAQAVLDAALERAPDDVDLLMEKAESFRRALRAAFREDPDIILVGEMRDLETTALAITAAETGHLVLATVHTTTASSTVDRIIDQFPPDRQPQIRVMLSTTLKAVVTQALCRRKVKGRIAAFEILVVHSAVQNLILEKKTYQLPSVIQTGRKYGMCTMNESLMQLVEDGFIDLDEAFSKSVDKQDMNDRVNNHLLVLVQDGEMSPVEAVKKSYFRPNMIERLRAHGHGKSLKGVDLADLDLPDEQIV